MGDKDPAHSELEIRSIISQHDTALRKTFVRYRDPKTGHLQMTGFIKFCTDAQVNIDALAGSLCCRFSDCVLTLLLVCFWCADCVLTDTQVTAGARCTPKGVEEVFHKAMHHATDENQALPSMRFDEFVEAILRISVKRFAEYIGISAVEKLNMFLESNFRLTPIGSQLAAEENLPGVQALALVTLC
jgi:hypothetical protein